jgi:hypothetical protein
MIAKKRPTRRPQPKPSTTSRVPQRLPSDALVYTEYDITDEPLDNRDIKKLLSQVQAHIDDLYELAQHDPIQAIPELERLVMTYPGSGFMSPNSRVLPGSCVGIFVLLTSRTRLPSITRCSNRLLRVIP